MKLNTRKLVEAFEEAPYGDPVHKQTISKMGKAALRKVAEAMGLSKADYRVDYNPGGIAVTGEVMLHTDFVYVQICHGFGHSPVTILIRACKGRKDYCGLDNNYLSVHALENPKGMAETLMDLARSRGTL